MKKKLFTATFLLLVAGMVGTAAAAPGGLPAAHGVDGPTFGSLVAGLAQTDPGFLAEHASSCNQVENSHTGGLPAAHGVDGRTFGSLVAGLAQEDPAALVAHVTGC
ncbi:MAG: hypothetical protein QCH35_00685 [Methanomicrobiaceae archaeon]|nr:hypothetical protein [Methanomicrobiaceae archaeon]